ncbi:MAG: alkyl hydroperoxide reductase [Gemmatimonadaceae bacterium]
MRELEHRFPREIAVVGVHSGKYIAERDTARIREAANRLGNAHPIVNDRQFRVWRAYAVRAWPTLAIVDPQGYVVGTHAGEFTADRLDPVLRRLIAAYDEAGVIDRAPLHFPADPPAIAPGTLRYPGKVAVRGARIAIADTGHHRVLVGRLSQGGRRMTVERVAGAGAPGFADSTDPGAARFTTPNGVLFAGGGDPSDGEPADGDGVLYVADTGNHAVRAVALDGADAGAVRTVAGTGRQLRTQADMDAGALSSPWDLALADGTRETATRESASRGSGMLYVAMAGIHQIWAVDVATGRVRPHSGRFGEDIADGPQREALLAQPMGIGATATTAAPLAGRLWFVDAESSAVRWADLDPEGRVGTVVGTGLFDFGDQDGIGDEVRLQHPQGLTLHPASGRLLVADTYNGALKWVDPATRRAESWVRGFHEPSGLAVGRGVIYVADTNAHRIAVVDEGTGEIAELEIEMV